MASNLDIRYLDPRTLEVHPLNYRTHPEDQMRELDRSLEEFGYVVPLVWNRRTGHLLDGHGRRLRQINRDSNELVPVSVVDWDEVTELRFLAAIDRIGEKHVHDLETLIMLLRRVNDETGSMPPGFTAEEFRAMMLFHDAEVKKTGADGDHHETESCPRCGYVAPGGFSKP